MPRIFVHDLNRFVEAERFATVDAATKYAVEKCLFVVSGIDDQCLWVVDEKDFNDVTALQARRYNHNKGE